MTPENIMEQATKTMAVEIKELCQALDEVHTALLAVPPEGLMGHHFRGLRYLNKSAGEILQLYGQIEAVMSIQGR